MLKACYNSLSLPLRKYKILTSITQLNYSQPRYIYSELQQTPRLNFQIFIDGING